MKFKAGDQVELKSGSPRMTVIRYEGEDKVLCGWMANGEKREETFYEVQLQKWVNPMGSLVRDH